MTDNTYYSFFENLIQKVLDNSRPAGSSQTGRVSNNQITTVQKIIYIRFKYAMENISDAEIINNTP